tara:strand:+ start:30611 stop:31042 length:432 start_codon:yes stop_codon:yes gene_type:complete
MKKMLFTAAFALIGFMASAQFMVTMDIPLKNFDTDNFENYTKTIGVGYSINDTYTVGIKDIGIEDGIRLFGRYNFNESIYAAATILTKTPEGFEMLDFVTVEVGYSYNVYNAFFVEPSLLTALSPPEGYERDLQLNLGLAYRF